MIKQIMLGASALAATLALSVPANSQSDEDEIETHIVSTYHAAPGQYRNLLSWIARQDRVRTEAGLQPLQLYAHQNGANWDFLVIQPVPTDEQNDAMEAAAERLNVDAAVFEFRNYTMDHEDTYVAGPTTAAAFLAQADE